jgi:hypothetical protein
MTIRKKIDPGRSSKHAEPNTNEGRKMADKPTGRKHVTADMKPGKSAIVTERAVQKSEVIRSSRSRPGTPENAIDDFLESFTSRDDVKEILEDWAK